MAMSKAPDSASRRPYGLRQGCERGETGPYCSGLMARMELGHLVAIFPEALDNIGRTALAGYLFVGIWSLWCRCPSCCQAIAGCRTRSVVAPSVVSEDMTRASRKRQVTTAGIFDVGNAVDLGAGPIRAAQGAKTANLLHVEGMLGPPPRQPAAARVVAGRPPRRPGAVMLLSLPSARSMAVASALLGATN